MTILSDIKSGQIHKISQNAIKLNFVKDWQREEAKYQKMYNQLEKELLKAGDSLKYSNLFNKRKNRNLIEHQLTATNYLPASTQITPLHQITPLNQNLPLSRKFLIPIFDPKQFDKIIQPARKQVKRWIKELEQQHLFSIYVPEERYRNVHSFAPLPEYEETNSANFQKGIKNFMHFRNKIFNDIIILSARVERDILLILYEKLRNNLTGLYYELDIQSKSRTGGVPIDPIQSQPASTKNTKPISKVSIGKLIEEVDKIRNELQSTGVINSKSHKKGIIRQTNPNFDFRFGIPNKMLKITKKLTHNFIKPQYPLPVIGDLYEDNGKLYLVMCCVEDKSLIAHECRRLHLSPSFDRY